MAAKTGCLCERRANGAAWYDHMAILAKVAVGSAGLADFAPNPVSRPPPPNPKPRFTQFRPPHSGRRRHPALVARSILPACRQSCLQVLLDEPQNHPISNQKTQIFPTPPACLPVSPKSPRRLSPLRRPTGSPPPFTPVRVARTAREQVSRPRPPTPAIRPSRPSPES
jgi:hypothetical protein